METTMVSRVEWGLVVRGILAILFGIVALIFTGQTLLALVYVFGAFALLSGLLALVMAARAGESHVRWGWLLFEGIVGVAAGIVCFVWPGITALALVFLIGAWALVIGVTEIVFALAWPDTLGYAWLGVLSGALSIVFGFVLLLWPRSGAIALTWLVGIYAILYGAALLYYAYRIHRFGHDVGTLFGRGHTPQPTS